MTIDLDEEQCVVVEQAFAMYIEILLQLQRDSLYSPTLTRRWHIASAIQQQLRRRPPP